MCATWNRARVARVISVELVTSCLVGQSGARAPGDAKRNQSPNRRGSEADCRPQEPVPSSGSHRCKGVVYWGCLKKLLQKAAMSVSGLGKRC